MINALVVAGTMWKGSETAVKLNLSPAVIVTLKLQVLCAMNCHERPQTCVGTEGCHCKKTCEAQ